MRRARCRIRLRAPARFCDKCYLDVGERSTRLQRQNRIRPTASSNPDASCDNEAECALDSRKGTSTDFKMRNFSKNLEAANPQECRHPCERQSRGSQGLTTARTATFALLDPCWNVRYGCPAYAPSFKSINPLTDRVELLVLARAQYDYVCRLLQRAFDLCDAEVDVEMTAIRHMNRLNSHKGAACADALIGNSAEASGHSSPLNENSRAVCPHSESSGNFTS